LFLAQDFSLLFCPLSLFSFSSSPPFAQSAIFFETQISVRRIIIGYSILEIIEMADQDILDIGRSRQVEQE
jgi:hypothetical protein